MLIPGTHIEQAHMHSHGRVSDKERCALAHALTGHAYRQADNACALGLRLKCKRAYTQRVKQARYASCMVADPLF